MRPSDAVPPALILAAGRGNRLLPLTADRPKCLLEVGERALLLHQLRALTLAGVRNIQIVTGHGADIVTEVCGPAVRYAHNERYDVTNSFFSFGCADVDVEPAGMLVLNSDVLFHPDLLVPLIADGRENVILADFDARLGEEEMKIITQEDGRVSRISKSIEPSQGLAENLGILKLGPAVAGRMLAMSREESGEDAPRWVPDAIDRLAGEFEFYTLPIEGAPWIEIDYPHDLERARAEVYPLVRDSLWSPASRDTRQAD